MLARNGGGKVPSKRLEGARFEKLVLSQMRDQRAIGLGSLGNEIFEAFEVLDYITNAFLFRLVLPNGWVDFFAGQVLWIRFGIKLLGIDAL